MVRFETVGLDSDTGRAILRDVSFDLEQGSFHFVTGDSGAGKSALLGLIGLTARPSRGRISVLGQDDVIGLPRRSLPGLRRRIGIVFQNDRLLNHRTVRDNVTLPLRLAGEDAVTIERHAEEMLGWIGLEGRFEARPADLSSSERRRVAIARAVIGRPALLLADEPTRAIGDAAGLRYLFLFEKLSQLGVTVVVATRNETIPARFQYPCLHLAGGRLQAVRAFETRSG